MATRKIYSVGEKIGISTFIREAGLKGFDRRAIVRCFCGNEYEGSIYALKKGRDKGCGCENAARIKYEIGQKIGECTIIREVEMQKGHRRFIFLCHCGKEFTNYIKVIKGGKIKGCGCLKSAGNRRTHGYASRITGETPEYQAWMAMKFRCLNNKSNQKYDRYGGRGIKVCDRWLYSFENFYADMGPRPSNKHTVDRFPDNNGNYEPSNCRWGTPLEQANNKRNNINITFLGETKTLANWARTVKMSRDTLVCRHKNNWPVKYLLTTPVTKRHLKQVLQEEKSGINHSFGFISQ